MVELPCSAVNGSLASRYSDADDAPSISGSAMPRYLQFEVSLVDIEPRIWRRFLLRETVTFNALSTAIQDAGPWAGYHLWEFCELGRPRRVIAGLPNRELDIRAPDARRLRVRYYFAHFGDRCLYRYDFGDDWDHEVKFEQPV
jgi:hypothetical protein